MTNQLFLQMSGAPGSGKTTIANAIAQEISAVIIDHDVTKSALLDAGVPVSIAGKASYSVLHALAQHLLDQGRSVIFDSPCYYEDLLKGGQELARRAAAAYVYIECVVKDLDELDRRLRTRTRHRSQVTGVRSEPTDDSGKKHLGDDVFREWIRNMKRPKDDYLVLDTTRPLEACVADAMTYIDRRLARYQRD